VGLITFLFLMSCLDNQLTNWDDLGYVITNPLIKDTSADAVKNIFALDLGKLEALHPVMGNYHPLTIVLHFIEYSYVGLQPWLYHFDSLLMHVLATLAAYAFVKTLTRSTIAAAIASLLFGLHPMHMESVAWVAGRKDLIYSFFFLLGCVTHLYYLRNTNKKALWYTTTFLLFGVSLLAKSVGVVFPIVLLLLDLYEQRKFSVMMFVEKAPFFILSLLFGILSVHTQKGVGALGTLDVEFSWLETTALGSYALIAYLWKAIIPTGLSNFYPYPMKVNDTIPAIYFAFPAIVLGLSFVTWKFGRKNRIVVFGALFFLVNIALLLQIVHVGGAIMSDRYTYIPYLGLFIMAGWFVARQVEQKTAISKPLLASAVLLSLVFGAVSNARCKDWYDSVSLWRDNIEKHPESPIAYFYLGQEYYTRFELEPNPNEKKALGDSCYLYFMKSIERKPDYINPIVCVGEYQRATGQIDEAKKTYLKAREIDPKNESTYLGLGVVYAIKQQYDSAEQSFRKAVSLKAYFPEAHSNYANFFDIVGKVDSSLKEYAIAISQNPDAYIPYMNRGNIYVRLSKWDEAMNDFSKAIMLKPEQGEPYYQRAKCYAQKGNKQMALRDVEAAVKARYDKVDQAFYNSLKTP
jgi:tetratricopeptide (TPR) repeat protein